MATLPKLLILVRRYWGLKPVWLTEYGYQTNPPDQFLGVPPRQAGDAAQPRRDARVASRARDDADPVPLRDEPQLSRFQTGLDYVDDKPKPSLNGFRLPFAEMKRSGVETMVWGQLRDGKPGRKQYEVQVLQQEHVGAHRRHAAHERQRRLRPHDPAEEGLAAPGLVTEAAALQPAGARPLVTSARGRRHEQPAVRALVAAVPLGVACHQARRERLLAVRADDFGRLFLAFLGHQPS